MCGETRCVATARFVGRSHGDEVGIFSSVSVRLSSPPFARCRNNSPTYSEFPQCPADPAGIGGGATRHKGLERAVQRLDRLCLPEDSASASAPGAAAGVAMNLADWSRPPVRQHRDPVSPSPVERIALNMGAAGLSLSSSVHRRHTTRAPSSASADALATRAARTMWSRSTGHNGVSSSEKSGPSRRLASSMSPRCHAKCARAARPSRRTAGPPL